MLEHQRYNWWKCILLGCDKHSSLLYSFLNDEIILAGGKHSSLLWRRLNHSACNIKPQWSILWITFHDRTWYIDFELQIRNTPAYFYKNLFCYIIFPGEKHSTLLSGFVYEETLYIKLDLHLKTLQLILTKCVVALCL